MRRIICFIVALGLLAGGVGIVGLFPWSKLSLLAGALCGALGGAWLWNDFIKPMLGTEVTSGAAVSAAPVADVTPLADMLRPAEAGDAEAQNAVGLWYAANLPGTGHAETWFRRAADQGLPRAQHNMGVLAFRASREEEAMAWFEKAAEAGWAPSMFALGGLLEEQGNIPHAAELYEAAARQGDANAQDALGRLAFDEDTEASYAPARQWSELAAEQGHAGAQARLGTIYHEGLGVARDPRQAASWFLKAAQRGHAGAQLMIGAAYHLGIGVETNRVAAVRWLTLSRDQGNAPAGAYLERVFGELTPAEKLSLRQEQDQQE
jgi:TPR repeat protein